MAWANEATATGEQGANIAGSVAPMVTLQSAIPHPEDPQPREPVDDP